MATLEQIAAALQSGTPGQALGISPAQTIVPIATGGSSPTPSSATPQTIGTATAGTSTDYSRGDHVHAAQLADLSDVSSAAPSSGQVLEWSGTEWAPATPAAAPTPSSATPQAIGTATAGTSADYSRGDHVHAAQLADLSDVSSAAPSSGQVLEWGGSEWAPATPAAAPTPSSATPQAIGTATAGTSTDYSRGDHVHAAAVTALSDRFERLPLQSLAEFADAATRDIQTAIDAHTSGAAAIILAAPGSYPGATVAIGTGYNNFALVGAAGTPYGGTITSLSGGRGLTVSGAAVRIRVQNLQIEGLTTWTTSGAGVHRIDRCQLVGGLTLGASWPAGTQLIVTDCTIAGTVTIPAGFPGVVIFDRCDFTGATFSIDAGLSALQVSFSSCSGLATVPSPATLNSFNAIGVGLAATVQAWFNGAQGASGQVLTSAGAGAAPTWQTPSGIAYVNHTNTFTTNDGSSPNFTDDHRVTGLDPSSSYLIDSCIVDNVGGAATQLALCAATVAQTAGVSTPTTQQQAAIMGAWNSQLTVSSLPPVDGLTGTYAGPRQGFGSTITLAPAVVVTDSAGRLHLRGFTGTSGGSFRAKIRLRKVSV
jgi:hypothetical protein